jgi:DNA-binding MarR family transcriptional regulator
VNEQRRRELCLQVARECTAARLRRAARAVAAVYDEAIADAGVRGTQLSLLTALYLSGEAPVSRLAELLDLDRTTMTRNLEPLEREGLIETDGAGGDRRVRLVRLTPRGARALDRGLPRWQGAQEKVKKRLGGVGWRRLMRELDALSGSRGRP